MAKTSSDKIKVTSHAELEALVSLEEMEANGTLPAKYRKRLEELRAKVAREQRAWADRAAIAKRRRELAD